MNDSTVPPPRIAGCEQMLEEELEQLRIRRLRVLNVRDSELNAQGIAAAHEFGSLGVGLSGGGIRSATFNLGILQGLASHGLLPYIDYLSTVSGGGYIGTWLHGVIKRPHAGDPYQAAQAIDPEEHHAQTFGDAARDPIAFLRMYSNYLAPRPGLFSADSWVIGVIWLRNMFLNQLILVPAIAAAILAIILGCEGLCSTAVMPHPIIMGVVFLALFVVLAGANLRAIAQQEFDTVKQLPILNSKIAAWPAVLAVIVAACVGFRAHWDLSDPLIRMRTLFLCFFCLFCAFQLLGGFMECFTRRHPSRIPLGFVLQIVLPLAATAVTVAALYASFYLLAGSYRSVASAIWGPPLLIAAMSVGVVFHIGLMGSDFSDASREWLARAGAIVSILCVAWIALSAISLYGPYWVFRSALDYGLPAATTLVTWAGTSIIGLRLGSSSQTSGTSEKLATSPIKEAIAQAAPAIFVLGLLVLVATAVHVGLAMSVHGVANLAAFLAGYDETLRNLSTNDWQPWAFLVCLMLPAVLLPLRFNINEFSLLHFYKNRLVRCYLGAGNTEHRKPNWFTGFDPKDDFPLASLLPTDQQPYFGPFAIVNTALNTNIGAEMGRQERKASSFVFTPLRSGFSAPCTRVDRQEVARDKAMEEDGFRLTKGYLYPKGPDIGTVTGISGAAANPNMGYHTSAAVAFLLTWFSVRLGWWVGNPRIRCLPAKPCAPDRPGPLYSIRWLFQELLAQTTARSSYLNLSDGGHFDNIGLYELVRRRCRYIIIGDAEADPDLSFESLGGAIRKCRADFDVDIEIDVDRIRAVNMLSGSHCVVGQVIYPENTTETNHRFATKGPIQAGKQRGWLLYLKSSVTGDEPEDIKQYKASHPVFPHDPTENQFFTESLFESYRRLGQHIVSRVFENVDRLPQRLPPLRDDPPQPAGAHRNLLDSLFQDLAALWYSSSALTPGVASKHADAYTALMNKMASDAQLRFLDEQVNKAGNGPVQQLTPELELKVKFFMLELIQLMENVWADFHMESLENRNNPNNAGWMGVFVRWSGGQYFQTVWNASHGDYNPLFQKFVAELQRPLKVH